MPCSRQSSWNSAKIKRRVLAVKPVCIAVLLLLAAITSGQQNPPAVTPNDTLEAIPQPLRQSLVTRLALLEQHERNRHWKREYELVTRRGGSETPTAFALRMTEYSARFISFVVTDTRKSQADDRQWFLYGHITLRESGRVECYEGRVVANLDDGVWNFTPILDSILVPIDAPPVKCRWR